ncbi:MAG TPA: Rieske 2Fe-2S domain-containing protein [Stellaceae bacterium]|nr:Rieske 2Fe-2S domain-containing protein [Stellaceae bacterium]
MSKQKDGEDLTRVGPGTVMGALMRQYWLPAAMSKELERDGPPLRLLLLGERLIAFRDSEGRVGVMDHRCPHRCASLFLGRNEEGGIRCVYHGWKFDAAGNCIDMPNTPPHQDYKHKVKAKAYKVAERNGLVWVYMGAREEAPPLPLIEASLLSEPDLQILFAQRECNWLQALEGDIDTSHFGFLHAGAVAPADVPTDNLIHYTIANRAPEYHVADTDWGTLYAAYRPAEAGRTYWRFANFLFPFWTQTPQGAFDRVNSRAWVPMDDTHTMFVSLSWKNLPPERAALSSARMLPGSRLSMDFLPNTTDWLGRWRLAGNEGNDWLIDREAQRQGGIYTGITGIYAQDQAVTESMGGITDHTFEHLGPSDRMITQTRRRLLRAARALRANGALPPGVLDPEIMSEVRSGDFLTETGIGWREAYAAQMAAAMRPLQQAAE